MTGHYPATHQRAGTGKNGPVFTSTCSCGWKHPAVSHDHSCKLFEAHHVDKTGKAPPPPPIVPRRTHR